MEDKAYVQKFTPYITLIVIIAGIGGILYGFGLGIVNGALLFVEKDIPMTATELSLMVASVLGGGAIATLISGSLADWLGRLKMMLIASVIFIIGVWLNVEASNYAVLLSGRLIQGVAIGVVSIVCPLYLSEIMPANLRGRGVNMFQLLVTIGILLANVVGWYYAKHGGDWRAMFGVAFVPGILFFILLWCLPESPRWLVWKQKLAAAKKALGRIYASHESTIQTAMTDMQNQQMNDGSGLKAFFSPHFLKPLLLVLAFACLNQLTGINSFLQYNALMLKAAGANSSEVAMVGSVWVTLINVIVTLIAFTIIDKVGRKVLLSIGSAGVTIALLFMGIIYIVLPDSSLKANLFLVGLLFMIVCFAMGPGAVIYLVLSELLPTPIRSEGMSVALFLNACVSTGLAAVFLPVSHAIGFGGLFIICACFTASYFYLAAFKMPETRGKSLETIEQEELLEENDKHTGGHS